MHPFIRPLYAAAGLVAEAAAAAVPGATGKVRRALTVRKQVARRFEQWGRRLRQPSRPLLWIHAPSVGEGLQARPVLQALRTMHPEFQLAYTYFSPSAASFAAALDVDFYDVLPFDTARGASTVLGALRPTAIIFSKLDVWPMLVEEAHRRAIPLALISATLSAGSSRSSKFAKLLLRDAYAQLSAVGAISAPDAARLIALGCRAEAVRITGDTRFDQVIARARDTTEMDSLLAPLRSDRPTLVAGSTWPADEREIFPALTDARIRERRLRMIIAPHEPTALHLAPIEQWATESGLRHARLGAVAAATADIVIVDRVGVLGDLYALGDIAFVGGGFHAAGLHSVLEPAAYGIPVVFGPRHSTSRDAALLIEAGGAREVRDREQLISTLSRWLDDPIDRRAAGSSARQVVDDNAGATQRSVALIESILPGPSIPARLPLGAR